MDPWPPPKEDLHGAAARPAGQPVNTSRHVNGSHAGALGDWAPPEPSPRSGIGSWGGWCLSLEGCVTGTGATRGAIAAGVSLGLIHPAPAAVREQRKKLQKGKTLTVALLGRAVSVMHTPEGLRALSKDKPDDPGAVARYLEGKFGEVLPDVRAAMNQLARSRPPKKLAAEAYALYEKFRPAVPAGTRGGGAKGELDLARLKALAE